MSKKLRQKAELQACGVCLAGIGSPCVHRVTRRPIKKMHFGRTYKAQKDLVSKQVARIELDEDPEEFHMFCCVSITGHHRNYPAILPASRWVEFYLKFPELDPQNQYHGEW